MTATQSVFQPIAITDFSQAYNDMHLVAALQSELAILQAKVKSYYHEEIVLRGDKILMREYRGHFGIEP
jgi:hypothetical protein